MRKDSDYPIETETSQSYLRRLGILDTVKKLESEDPQFRQRLIDINKTLDSLSHLEQQHWDIEGSTTHIVFDTKDALAAVIAWHAHGSFPGGQYILACEISCDGKVFRLNTYHEGRSFDQLASFKDQKGRWHLRGPNEREKAENYLNESPMLKDVARLVRFNPRTWFRMKRIRRALEDLSRDGETRWRTNTMFDIAFEDAKQAAAELVWRAYGRCFQKVTYRIFIEENCVRVVTHYKGTGSTEASIYAFKDKGRYRVCLVGGYGFE